jgi:hypothetical protein
VRQLQRQLSKWRTGDKFHYALSCDKNTAIASINSLTIRVIACPLLALPCLCVDDVRVGSRVDNLSVK